MVESSHWQDDPYTTNILVDPDAFQEDWISHPLDETERQHQQQHQEEEDLEDEPLIEDTSSVNGLTILSSVPSQFTASSEALTNTPSEIPQESLVLYLNDDNDNDDSPPPLPRYVSSLVDLSSLTTRDSEEEESSSSLSLHPASLDSSLLEASSSSSVSSEPCQHDNTNNNHDNGHHGENDSHHSQIDSSLGSTLPPEMTDWLVGSGSLDPVQRDALLAAVLEQQEELWAAHDRDHVPIHARPSTITTIMPRWWWWWTVAASVVAAVALVPPRGLVVRR